MWLKRIAAAAALAVSACQTPLVRPAAFEGALAQAAERSGAPGMVAAIYRDGRIAELFAWGGAACDGAGAADPYAAYEIGSISKHVAAVALLQLWEQGRVDLDAPVGRYLDAIPEHWRAVTLRQLLTHTSGVPDYEEAGGYGIYETRPSPADIFAIVAERPLDFEPGTRWSYSNTGYVLVSLVVARVSGQRFGDYLRERVFGPIGLNDTFMGGYAPGDVALAQGCKPAEDGKVPVAPIHEASTFGAGGVLTTLADWARWDHALHGGRLLSPAAMELLLTPQRLSDGENTEYGFGVIVDEFRGEPRRHHSGQTQGFVAYYAHYPERGVSTMIMANTYGGGIGGVSRALAIRAMPDLSYDRLAPADDPGRVEEARRALRQLVLNETPHDLLSEALREIAASGRFADPNSSERRWVAQPMTYLRSEPGSDGVRRDLFRVIEEGETTYLTFYWSEGRMVGIRSEDE